MIFKIGSDIALLKLNRHKIKCNIETLTMGTVKSLPDYYEICAAGPLQDHQQSICQRLQLMEQTPRNLELKF